MNQAHHAVCCRHVLVAVATAIAALVPHLVGCQVVIEVLAGYLLAIGGGDLGLEVNCRMNEQSDSRHTGNNSDTISRDELHKVHLPVSHRDLCTKCI